MFCLPCETSGLWHLGAALAEQRENEILSFLLPTRHLPLENNLNFLFLCITLGWLKNCPVPYQEIIDCALCHWSKMMLQL